MADSPSPIGSRSARPCTLDRLRVLLDAYGASPDRWPSAERDAALTLLAESREAQGLQTAAAALDGALDLVPAPEPSAELLARALAHAPRKRAPHVRRWLAAATLPLAAAAALALWLTPRQNAPSPEPARYAAINYQGVYTTPTDLLLEPPGFDLSSSSPTVGCTAGDLGCPELDVPTGQQSGRRQPQAVRA